MKYSTFNKFRFDPRKYYTIFIELGIIASLLVFIIATKIPISTAEKVDFQQLPEQETVVITDAIQTKQPELPAAPPPPMVPIEVPNSEIIEEQILNLSADISFDEPLDIPPPPEKDTTITDQVEKEENFFIAVEQMPELIGSLGDLQSKIEYPEKARLAGIDGLVVIQFIVNKKGEVEDPQVIRGIGGGCDEEALRVVKTAKFVPGKQRGEPVRVRYSVPIFFVLKDKDKK